MWDYTAFPVWSEGGKMWPEPLENTPLGQELQAWSDEWTDARWREKGPDDAATPDPSPEHFADWDARGRVLAARLREQLGPDFDVGYFDEDTGEVEWP